MRKVFFACCYLFMFLNLIIYASLVSGNLTKTTMHACIYINTHTVKKNYIYINKYVIYI